MTKNKSKEQKKKQTTKNKIKKSMQLKKFKKPLKKNKSIIVIWILIFVRKYMEK